MHDAIVTPSAWLALAAPLSFAAVPLLAAAEPGRDPLRVLAASRLASAISLVTAVATAAAVAAVGPMVTPLFGADGAGFALRLDALSAVMFVLIAFLGSVVLEYSRHYLDGDSRHGVFLGRLATTLAAVSTFVLSGNLLQLWLFWLLTSLALHNLLLFYPGRAAAVVAARKKFLVARTADVALAGAALLLVHSYGTGDIGLLNERAAAAPAPLLPLAAMLVVATAALKSAQFPTHGWLAEVMETPTPVSALLHAGILNGGAFLLARLAPALAPVDAASVAMVVIGGFTALFASMVMTTQPTIKGALAYSSAAHMGFMMLLCGIGAHTVAIVHLVGHSCYKAHAFLSSGSTAESARASRIPHREQPPSAARVAMALALAGFVVASLAMVAGAPLAEDPVQGGLAAMLALGLAHLLVRGSAAPRLLANALAAAAVVAAAFYLLEAAGTRLLGAALPHGAVPARVVLAWMATVIGAFAAAVLAQQALPFGASSPRRAVVWVHVRNGMYANALFDRMIGALRLIAARSASPEVNG